MGIRKLDFLDKVTVNISKEVLNTIITPINLDELSNSFSDTEHKCSECPLSKIKEKAQAKEICGDNCTYKKSNNLEELKLSTYMKNQLETYNREDSSERIKELVKRRTYRIPHLGMKLLILYYSLVDSKGVLLSYKKKYLAEALGCSIRTINNLNNILNTLGFITLGNKEYGKVTLLINNYSKQHETKGTGYLVLSNEFLQILLNSPSVHITILLIKSLLKHDFNRAVTLNETAYKYEDLKKLIPSIAYPKGISDMKTILDIFTERLIEEEIIDKKAFDFIESTSDMQAPNYSLTFIMNTNYCGKTIIKGIKSKAEHYFKDFAKGYSNSKKFKNAIKDLVALSCEFGLDKVKEIISDLSEDKYTATKNIGALVRQGIYNKKIAADTREFFQYI